MHDRMRCMQPGSAVLALVQSQYGAASQALSRTWWNFQATTRGYACHYSSPCCRIQCARRISFRQLWPEFHFLVVPSAAIGMRTHGCVKLIPQAHRNKKGPPSGEPLPIVPNRRHFNVISWTNSSVRTSRISPRFSSACWAACLPPNTLSRIASSFASWPSIWAWFL